MKVVVVGTNQKDRESVAKVIKDKYEGLAKMNEGLRDNKRYLENDLALKMEQIAGLELKYAKLEDEFHETTFYLDQLSAHNWYQKYLKLKGDYREQIADLKKRLAFIFDVWGRWKDFERTSYPTIEQTHHALYDFGEAIEKAMTGYNPE